MKILSAKKYEELMMHSEVYWRSRKLLDDVLFHWIFNPIARCLYNNVPASETIIEIHKGFEDREGWAKQANERLKTENELLRKENEHLREAFKALKKDVEWAEPTGLGMFNVNPNIKVEK